jgi:hypothetical protein
MGQDAIARTAKLVALGSLRHYLLFFASAGELVVGNQFTSFIARL